MTQNTHLSSTESMDKLDPNNWQRISVGHKLNILYQIRKNLTKYGTINFRSDSSGKLYQNNIQ